MKLFKSKDKEPETPTPTGFSKQHKNGQKGLNARLHDQRTQPRG